MRVVNDIPLGCSLLLPVGTVNCVQTLKGRPLTKAMLAMNSATPLKDPQRFSIVQTMNSVATLMASHTTEGRVWCRVALCLCSTLTMNSVATLMASHNTEGRVWCRGDAVPVFNDNHELCRYTDDVTQH